MVKLKSKLKLNCMCVYFFIITLLIGIWFISEIVTTFRFMKGNDLCIINLSRENKGLDVCNTVIIHITVLTIVILISIYGIIRYSS
jgi:hypothetical protein